VYEEVRQHAGRLIPFAVLNPAYAGWRDDLAICQKFGMKGLRLYPRWHDYRLTDRPCLDLVRAAAERRMPVSIPIRVEDRRQQSWLVDIVDVAHDEIAALVRAAPEAQFILVNGSGFTGSVLGRKDNGLPPNYAIDIALMTAEMRNEIGALLENLGEDRVVFGTGMPFHYADPALAKLEILDASDRVKEKIRQGNAARILGL
jgi:predicted TIM-barrel fold metal-dependent hydrolase